MILVGYHSTGAYKLFDPVNKKVVISNDVIVDETKEWDWNNNIERQTSDSVEVDLGQEEIEEDIHIDNELDVNNEQNTNEEQPVIDQPNMNEIVPVRRSLRQANPPARFQDYDVFPDSAINSDGDLMNLVLLAEAEPISLEEALASPHWKKAMDEELKSIQKNKTWEMVRLPSNKKAIEVKWVFKTKLKPSGEVAKYKARLVAKGFLQKPGLDFNEIYAPVARIETVRLIVAIASLRNWTLSQLDVKSAFLNGPLEEEVFVRQPPGYVKKGMEDSVMKLNKALYGLRQAPRAWNLRIDRFLQQLSFVKCTTEHGVYVKNSGNVGMMLLCLYVDDLLVTGDSEQEISKFKSRMMDEFEMSDIGRLTYFLGLEFVTSNKGVFLHQKKYATDILKRFNMLNCNPATTPCEPGIKLVASTDNVTELVDSTLYRQLIGSLRYLCNSRPDITYSVGLVSRFMEKPCKDHMLAAKRILRYVKGTLECGILFPAAKENSDIKITGYTDADWSGNISDRKSTSGYIFMLGNAPISWCSKKQEVVALSSCEAEYISAAFGASQALWLNMLLKELDIKCSEELKLRVDNRSAIDLAKHPIAHGRSKHIEVKYHFLRDNVSKNNLVLEHCRTEDQYADMLTKALKPKRLEELKNKIGMHNLTSLN